MKKLRILKKLVIMVALLSLGGCPATRHADTSTLNIVPPVVDSSPKHEVTLQTPPSTVTPLPTIPPGESGTNKSKDIVKSDNDKKTEHPPLTKHLEAIYFGFDRHDLDAEARTALDRNFTKLGKDTSEYTLEGYCDEVGSAEYNIALGQKRAEAVQKYLLTRAITAERLSVVSYGKEYPADPGSSDSAHQKNRRVEFWSKNSPHPGERSKMYTSSQNQISDHK